MEMDTVTESSIRQNFNDKGWSLVVQAYFYKCASIHLHEYLYTNMVIIYEFNSTFDI